MKIALVLFALITVCFAKKVEKDLTSRCQDQNVIDLRALMEEDVIIGSDEAMEVKFKLSFSALEYSTGQEI